MPKEEIYKSVVILLPLLVLFCLFFFVVFPNFCPYGQSCNTGWEWCSK